MDCEFLLYVMMFAFEQRRSLSNTPGSSVRMKFVNSKWKICKSNAEMLTAAINESSNTTTHHWNS